MKCSLLLLQALAGELMSQDVWYLAMRSAQARAREAGIQQADDIFMRLAERIVDARKNGFVGTMDRAGFF